MGSTRRVELTIIAATGVDSIMLRVDLTVATTIGVAIKIRTIGAGSKVDRVEVTIVAMIATLAAHLGTKKEVLIVGIQDQLKAVDNTIVAKHPSQLLADLPG